MAEHVVHKSVSFQAAPEVLFHTLVSERAMTEWMTAEVELEAKAGGSVEVAIEGWPLLTGEVEVYDTPSALRVRWQSEGWPGPLTTVITIDREGDGSRLMLHETGYGDDDELCRTRDYLWSHWLARLAAVSAPIHNR